MRKLYSKPKIVYLTFDYLDTNANTNNNKTLTLLLILSI